MRAPVTVRVQREDFDLNSEVAKLSAGRADIGAITTFSEIGRAHV